MSDLTESPDVIDSADRTQRRGASDTSAVRWVPWVIRLVVAAALVVDAVVHLRLAPGYQTGQPAGIGTGNVFRIEAGVALLAALLLLVWGNRASYALAFLVAFSAFVAVVLYRYVDVPGFGPIPPMYEPVWFFQKSLSAVAEALGAVLAAVGFFTTPRRRGGKPAPAHRQ